MLHETSHVTTNNELNGHYFYMYILTNIMFWKKSIIHHKNIETKQFTIIILTTYIFL